MTDTLPAGRELDALVAEKVMGWQWQDRRLVAPDGVIGTRYVYGTVQVTTALPHYSTNIGAAWDVVDRLLKETWQAVAVYAHGNGQHMAKVFYCEPGWRIDNADDVTAESVADAAPHAICLAALQAVTARQPSTETDHD